MAPYISQTGLSALMWVGVGLSGLFVAIRTHVQYRKTRKLFVNDHCIFFAMLCHLATAAVYQPAIPLMYEVQYFDYRTQALTPRFMADASLFLRLQFALDFLLWTTLWAVKFSLLFFFWRLFDSVDTPMRIFWWAMCAITASSWITLVVLQNLACDPLRDFFVLGKCDSARDIYYSNLVFKFSAGADIACDILIMLIPFPLLRKLHVNARTRLLLAVLFALPIIPITFAVLRLVMANATTSNVDPVKFQLFSMLENSSAIVTSCLPALRLFIVGEREAGAASSLRQRYSVLGRRGGRSNYFSTRGRACREFKDDSTELVGREMRPPGGVIVTRQVSVDTTIT
ncbi:hypothetical protein PHISP_01646 [Aspergillus sp. HF37]|nr:hypothetical protein PHISP_01646 [Aspergillus sp. HF37]